MVLGRLHVNDWAIESGGDLFEQRLMDSATALGWELYHEMMNVEIMIRMCPQVWDYRSNVKRQASNVKCW